jgi:hypothetical protein
VSSVIASTTSFASVIISCVGDWGSRDRINRTLS